MPPRAKEEAATINSTNHELLDNVGGNVSLEMQMPKLLWLSKHRPEVIIHLVVLVVGVIRTAIGLPLEINHPIPQAPLVEQTHYLRW